MSLLNVRVLKARWTLGWALIKYLMARPFLGRRKPLRWLSRLREGSLAVVPPEAWELFEPASRCIGCSICDAVGERGDKPSQWILSIARRPQDAPLASDALDRLVVLREAIERVCPARVQVGAIVELVRENSRMLNGR
ncbi:MAG: hypothetical protein V3T05_13475 [Myxococcota bacterium]